MKIIIGGKASGKTTELIKKANELGGYIICDNQERVRQVFALAKKLEIYILFPITIKEAFSYRGFPVPFLMDDVDTILNTLFRREIQIVTFNAEESEITRLPTRLEENE